MKTLLLSLVSIFFTLLTYAENDHIILRNGIEYDVDLIQISNNKVYFKFTNDKTNERKEIDLSEIYMLYLNKQGNIYISESGERITGESTRVNFKKYDVIYLVKGGEIGARNIKVSNGIVTYTEYAKGDLLGNIMGKVNAVEKSIAQEEVFMIKYRNGMNDILTSIENKPKIEEEKTEENVEPELKVVFHSVESGETLETISEKYNVTIDNIKEWNDLPKTQPTKRALKVGMQLMIYQPK